MTSSELMDTCSRLEEPGGVGWKDVDVGRLRTTTSGKRLIWSHRVAARSDRWPRNLGARFRVAAVGRATWGQAGADGGGAAPHNAGDACRRGTTRRRSPVPLNSIRGAQLDHVVAPYPNT